MLEFLEVFTPGSDWHGGRFYNDTSTLQWYVRTVMRGEHLAKVGLSSTGFPLLVQRRLGVLLGGRLAFSEPTVVGLGPSKSLLLFRERLRPAKLCPDIVDFSPLCVEFLHGESETFFNLDPPPEPGDSVMFIYINFAIRRGDIDGYIAMLLDMPSIAALQLLLRDYIRWVAGPAAS